MIAITKDGKYIVRENSVKITLWTPAQNEMGIRYSVLFEYDESKANTISDKYLTEVVGPKIPRNAIVIVQGYTDVIGDAANNKKLAQARAMKLKTFFQNI
jgi:outer membrane protein OmpA-like peptidoglycan-associated protein